MPEVAITIIVGAIGAIGGYVLGIVRFRHERAFDRRAAWYEDVVKKLNALSVELQGAIYDLERGRGDDVKTRLRSFKSKIESELFPSLSDRELYARQDGYDALQRYIHEVNGLGALGEAVANFQRQLGAPPGAGWRETALPLLRRYTDAAARQLADEFRRDMFGWWWIRALKLDRDRWRQQLPGAQQDEKPRTLPETLP